MATMTPHRSASTSRKPSIIRKHSPYGTGEGPIVEQGFVQARVRAIEGKFTQTNVSKSSRFPHVSRRKPSLEKRSRAAPSRRSHEEADHRSTAPKTPSLDNERVKPKQPVNYKKWQRNISSQQSHSSTMAEPIQSPIDRRSHSMLELHAQYSGSPHGGRKRYRDYSNLRRISAGSEIKSPQPLSPARQPVNINQRPIDDSAFWSETQPEHTSLLPVVVHRKSIAEGLDENLDVSQGQDEASTAWATEDEGRSYPFPAPKQSKRRSMSEEQPPTAGALSSQTEYSRYAARFLPNLDHSRMSSDASPIDDELRLKRTRSRRQVPHNTLESTSDAQQHGEVEPLAKFEARPRAMTANLPWRSVSDAAHRTRMQSLAVERLSDRRSPDRSAKALKAPLKASEKEETESTPSGEPEDGSQATSQLKACEKEETESTSSRELEDGSRATSQLLTGPPPYTKPRQCSVASRGSSVGVPRPLTRVWTTLSTWRLALHDRRPNTSELAEEEQASRSATPTPAELPADEIREKQHHAQEPASVFQPPMPTSTKQSTEAREQFDDKSLQESPQEDPTMEPGSADAFQAATPASIDLPAEAAEGHGGESHQRARQDTPSTQLRPADEFQLATRSSVELPPEGAEQNSDESLRESPEEVSSIGSGSAHAFHPTTQAPVGSPPEAAEQTSHESLREFHEQVPSIKPGSAHAFHPATLAPVGSLPEAAEQTNDDSVQKSPQQLSSVGQEPADVFHPITPTSIQLSSGRAEKFNDNSLQEASQGVPPTELKPVDVLESGTPTSTEPSPLAADAEQISDKTLYGSPQSLPSIGQRPTDAFESAKLTPIDLPTEAAESNNDPYLQESPRYMWPGGSEQHATYPANQTTTEPLEYTPIDPARRSEANETLMRLLRPSNASVSDLGRKRIVELSEASQDTEQGDQRGSTSAEFPPEVGSRPSPPTPHSAQRPLLSTARSHTSLRPSPARATTEVSNADPIQWTPPPSHHQPSPLSRKYSVLADHHRVHSSSMSLRDRYRAGSLAHSRPQSPTPSESASVLSGTSAYQSLQNSQYGMRRSRRNSQQRRDREQRIKRVKVVVSLDGGTDLVVDASVKPNRDVERDGECWRVRERVRRWEDSNEECDGHSI
ncbi:MAG: hypothetical protein Q9191_005615 [Dirinaria sp. TL-2023a]